MSPLLPAEAVLALVLAQAQVRLRPARTLAAGGEGGRGADGRDLDTARRVGRCVQRLAAWIPGSTCLVQAVAGRWLLARHGIGSTLCLGGQRDGNGRFLAHAWLELAGSPVLGEPSPMRFGPLPPAAGSTPPGIIGSRR
jgi:hypothetical protein